MYTCNSCGGELHYDIASGLLHCDYCDSKVSISAYMQGNRVAKEEEHQDELSVFSCPQCGGEIYSNDISIGGFCSYCGANVVLKRRQEHRQMPTRIVPFEVTKAECKQKYQEYVKKLKYVPKEYQDLEGFSEFRGIYVPFHSYTVTFDGTLDCKGKKDVSSGSQHTVTEYAINASTSGKVPNVVHDASALFSDYFSESVVASGETVGSPFHPAYLSGFYADLEDVEESSYEDYAKFYCEDAIKDAIYSKIRDNTSSGITFSNEKSNINVTTQYEEDILKPIWFLSHRTKQGRVTQAVVNGRTKEIVCDIPVDIKAFTKVSLIMSAVIFLILQLLFTFTPKNMTVCASYLNLFATLCYFSNVRTLYNREVATSVEPKIFKNVLSLFSKNWKYILIILFVFPLPLFFVAILGFALTSSAFFILILQIIVAIKNFQKYRAVIKGGTKPSFSILLAYISTILLIIVNIMHPVHDYWYYIAGCISFIAVLTTMITIILDYNLVCSQPLPQFARYKGGRNDENN